MGPKKVTGNINKKFDSYMLQFSRSLQTLPSNPLIGKLTRGRKKERKNYKHK